MDESKKVKCPKCGEMIDYLRNFTPGWGVYIFDSDGEYTYSETMPDDNRDDEFNCPQCGETLFGCEESAKEFLRGGQDGAR